jgi:tetratricopeptide (TPR) repeat protein
MTKGNGANGFSHRHGGGTGRGDGHSQKALGAAFEAMSRGMVGRMLGDIGHVLERRDRPEEALLLFQKAVETKPNDARAWYNLGDTLIALGRYHVARQCLEKAVSLGGDGWLVRYDLGLTLYELGEFERAANLFREIMESDIEMKRAPADPMVSVLTNLALCQGEMGRWGEAVSTLRPALKRIGSTVYNLGRFSLRGGNRAAAKRFLLMAAELEPDSEDILHTTGIALMEGGEFKAAEGYLRRATRIGPPCADAWYDLGVMYAKQRKAALRKTARRCFARALKVNPRHAWAHYDLACLDALAGKRDASFRHLDHAIALGLRARSHVVRDPDLKSLRRDAQWKDILSRLAARDSIAEPRS